MLSLKFITRKDIKNYSAALTSITLLEDDYSKTAKARNP